MKLGLEHTGGEHIWYRIKRESSLFIGKQQTGKSATLIRLALNDAQSRSVIFIDPFGDSVQEILKHIPAHRIDDVILVEPWRVPFDSNVLAHPNAKELPSLILEAVGHLWPSNIATTRINDFVLHGLHTALHLKHPSLFSVIDLLTDPDLKDMCPLSDDALIDFWKWYDSMTPREKRDVTSSTISRFRAFKLDARIRQCLLSMSYRIVLKDKIVLVDLNQARFGLDNARLFAALLFAVITLEGQHGLSTTLYVDGALPGVSQVMSRTSIPTFLAVQFLDQLGKERDLILSSIRNTIALRTTVADAKTLEPEFFLPTLTHLFDQPVYHCYLTNGLRPVHLSLPLHEWKKTHMIRTIRERMARL